MENEKHIEFKKDLAELLKKHKAEITIEDFGKEFRRDEQIVVSFAYDDNFFEKTGSGIINDLVLGTFIY